jgi:hypothetical protein
VNGTEYNTEGAVETVNILDGNGNLNKEFWEKILNNIFQTT